VRQFRGIAWLAKRKLEADGWSRKNSPRSLPAKSLNAPSRLQDLMVPPAKEKLKGKLKDFYSIRNDQWRVIFKWIDGEAHEVRIVDYH
jgi:toxin HigB-1